MTLLPVAALRTAVLCCALAMSGCERTDSAAEQPTPTASGTASVQPETIPQESPRYQTAAESPPAADDPPPIPTTTEPAAVQALAEEGNVPAFEPLADAEVGEWVHLAAMGLRELRYEIVRVGAAAVVTQVLVLQDGKPLGLPTEREDMRNWDPLESAARGVKATRSLSRGQLETAGYSWDCLIYEDRWTEEGVAYVRRTWVHPEAPVLGMLRMELLGDNVLEARLELKAFGRRGDRQATTKTR